MKIYATAGSVIEYEANDSLLISTWLKESINMTEEAVMGEIVKVLNFSRELKIRNVIIDSRAYPFRDNDRIQNWINFDYMSEIMDTDIEKYAIVVNEDLMAMLKELGGVGTDDFFVEYFTSMEDARKWIDA